mmetsp:Transcript_46726/g.149097  ORF Transcript_46726/g.149097 Transcript_46726/m.149097 type:complete len:210 (-) Transcript_46726:1430-2059(-)
MKLIWTLLVRLVPDKLTSEQSREARHLLTAALETELTNRPHHEKTRFERDSCVRKSATRTSHQSCHRLATATKTKIYSGVSRMLSSTAMSFVNVFRPVSERGRMVFHQVKPAPAHKTSHQGKAILLWPFASALNFCQPLWSPNVSKESVATAAQERPMMLPKHSATPNTTLPHATSSGILTKPMMRIARMQTMVRPKAAETSARDLQSG